MEGVPERVDLGVVGRRLHERGQRRPVLAERVEDGLERGADLAFASRQPRLGGDADVVLQPRTELEDQLALVAEVAVERRARQACAPDDLLDADLGEGRTLAEELERRGDDRLAVRAAPRLSCDSA